MKKLIIFMTMLLVFSVGTIYCAEFTVAQNAELARIKAFVKDLREKLPAETYIVTKDNFIQTADMIEYLLQNHGWKPIDYSIDSDVLDDETGTYAIYNIYIKLYTFNATFVTEGTFEYQDIESEGEPEIKL